MKGNLGEEERRRLLLEVARLYYQKRLSKTEISHEIRTSSMHVARLLSEAEREGIIQFRFVPPELERLGMELEQRFVCLRRAIVVPSVKDYSYQRRLLAEKAAVYFDASIAPGATVALGSGNTIYEMVTALPERQRGLQIYPAAIMGRGPTITHIDPVIVVTLLWAKSGSEWGTAYSVSVPPFDRGTSRDKVRRMYQQYAKQEKVRMVYDGMKTVNNVFLSIGSLEADAEYRNLTPSDTKKLVDEMGMSENELKQEGVVGDVNYSFFDVNGNGNPKWNLFLNLDVDQLRKMSANKNKSVVVIVGSYKVRALEALLKGKVCNVLITDSAAAQRLLAT